jgi:autotransporter-associated beta strand protein
VILSAITGGAGDYVNFPGYPDFSGPNGSTLYNQGGLSVPVPANQGPYTTPSGANTGYFGVAFDFTMGISATYRLGVAVDTVADGTYAPDYVGLYNSGVGTVFSSLLTRDGTPDMAIFEIDAAAGDTFTAAMWQLSGARSGAAAFSLITFDVSRYNLNVASGTQTNSSALGGSPAALLKTGAGTMVLTGANSYGGGTTISGGRVIAASSNALGDAASAITVTGGAFLDIRTNITRTGIVTFNGGYLATSDGAPASLVNNGGSFVLSNAAEIVAELSGTAGLTSGGTGTAKLWRSNSYTGATVVNAGTLRLDGSGALSTNSTLQIDSGAAFATTGTFLTSNNVTVAGLTGAGTVTGAAGTLTISKNTNTSDVFTGSINGGLALTLGGSTQLWLAGSNNYTGATTVGGSDTVLNLVHANGLGSTAAGTTVGNGSVLRIQGTNNGGSGITVGSEALTIIGQGRGGNGGALRSVSGTNTWQGKVILSGDARIGSGGGSFLTLDVASGNAVESADFNFATEGAGHIQVNDAVSLGTGSLTKLGTGSLILAAANSYSGGTLLSEGVLRLDNGSAAGSGSISQVTNNSTLQINTTGTVANAMSIFDIRTMQTVTLSGNKTLNNATYTVDAGTTTTESGNLSGTGGITKQGTGTLIVTGDNTYTGAVAVDTGVLNLNSSVGGAAATTSSVSVASGARLLLSQSEQVNDSATVTLSGGTIQRASGVSEVFGSLNLTAGSFLDFGTGATGTIQFGGYTPVNLLTVQNFAQGNVLRFGTDVGSFLPTAGALTNSYFSFNNAFSYDSGSFTITAIPEPSTYLAAAGLLGMMLWSVRRRAALRASFTMTEAPAADGTIPKADGIIFPVLSTQIPLLRTTINPKI